MRIIIDSNILISALIKDSFTRRIILESNLDLYFPEIGLAELQKYKDMILQKSEILEDEYNQLLSKILSKLKLIPTDKIKSNLPEAIQIMKNVDVLDAPFIAAALAHNAVIWSDDKDLKKQNKIQIMNSGEMAKFTGS